MSDFILNYSIISHTENNITKYGIEIEKVSSCIEKERVADITTSKEEILLLLNRIKNGSVTPVTLRDIAEDFVAEKSFI